MKEYRNYRQFIRRLNLALILLLFGAAGIFAQTRVSGTVTDDDGEVLIGVNIKVKGSAVGTITDLDGNYSIEVPGAETVLEFTYIGYLPAEKTVGTNTIIDVVLQQDLQELDEVIVVAYGTQKKSHLTGAVSSLKNDGLDEIPVSRADQALQGKLAGVQILNYNPEAGAAPVIRVRGMGSISADNEPLVVVDGFPVQDGLSMVSMGDVESIEVLKDAASSALYGSRAAGGVILITTKSGSQRKTKYNFKMYAGVTTPLKLPEMLGNEEYVELLFQEADLRMTDPAVDGIEISTMEFNMITNGERTAYLISRYVVDQPTDWTDEALRDYGSISNYQLSASGGDEKKQFYISGNYSSENGIMKNSSYDKFSLRTKVDFKLSDRITIGVNFNPTYSKKERPAVDLTNYMRYQTWVPIWHNDATAAMTGQVAGEYAQVAHFYGTSITGIGIDGKVWNMVGQNPWSTSSQTPVSYRDRTSRFDDNYRAQTNAYLLIDLAPGLQFKTSNGIYFSYNEYNMKHQSEARRSGDPNKLTRQLRQYSDLLTENLLTYDIEVGDHLFSALAGFTAQQSNSTFNQIVGTGFPDEERLSYNMAETFLKDIPGENGITSFYSSDALMSVLGRLNYSYKGRYLLTASIRADGSSKFADGHKWGTFPSGSVGWRISEEDFMNNASILSNLKIRASYGLTGNNNIPQYSYMNTVNTIDYVTGTGNGDLVTGMSSNSASLGNNEISWEQLTEANFGLDLGLNKNRYTISMEYYNSNTLQLLLKQPAMYITGHESFWNNIGKVNNKGVEIEFRATAMSTLDFNWVISGNFSTNQNTLLNYGDKDKEDNFGERTEVYRAKVGEESIQFFGYRTDGVYTTFEEVEEALALTNEEGESFQYTKFKPVIGGIKVVNVDGNNSLDSDDRVVLGSPFPDFVWGITNSFSYKNLDLGFLLQGSQGGELINGNINYNEQLRYNKAYTANRFVSPMYPGDGKTVYSTNTAGGQLMLTDYPIEDASYITLRDFSFGYTLPAEIARAIKLGGLRAYVSATNLFFIMGSNYRGVNPEARKTTSRYDNPLVDGYQRGVFPLSKRFTFGLDITF